ncbi:MAG: hypothetical protein IKY17_00495 [Oscillospiraceae bacterium]|nr:hypothetical protein [Oscillospiraceae bacterium]
MNDDMLLFFICVGIILYVIYRYSKRGGSYAAEVPIGPGTYRIGEDLDPGKCDLVAVQGGGDICIKERGNGVWNNPFKLAADNPIAPSRYRNMTLHRHDILEVNGKIQLMLKPPTVIQVGADSELTLGTYQFGVDILPPAKYDLTAEAGDGQFTFFEPKATEFSVFQDMALSADGKTSAYNNLLCEDGSRMVIDGTLKLKLKKSKKQRGKMQKMLDIVNQDP